MASPGESPDLDSGSSGARFRRSSTLYAAKMAEAMAEEDAEVAHKLAKVATADQVAAVRVAVDNISRRLEVHAQSQAAANVRADAAFAGLASDKTAVATAAASMAAAQPRRATSRAGGTYRGAQCARAAGGSVVSPSSPPGVAVLAAVPSAAAAVFSCPLVLDWAMPVEMMTARMTSRPLNLQLAEMVALCHVSIDEPGLFGSVACLRVYEEGVERIKALQRDGGGVLHGSVNTKKSERMDKVVKNKGYRYLKELYWLHGVMPQLFMPPAEATYQNMKGTSVDASTLQAILNREADALGLAPGHAIRVVTKARSNTLRALLAAKVGRAGATITVEHILSSSPFSELLAQAEKNVRQKYA